MPTINRTYIDTNIWLDVLLDRPLFVEESKSALAACIDCGIELLYAATSLKDIFYLAERSAGPDSAYKAIDVVLGLSRIAQIDSDICSQARRLERPDYEDGIIAASALAEQVDAIISRDEHAFNNLEMPKYTPLEFIELLGYEVIDL